MTAPTHPLADPTITEATVRQKKVVRIGDRVKHFGQRYTSNGTATVIGFYDNGSPGHPWIKVLVKTKRPTGIYEDIGQTQGWDWDRTELPVE